MCGCANNIVVNSNRRGSFNKNKSSNSICKYKLSDLLSLDQNNFYVKSAINLLKNSPKKCNLLNKYIDEIIEEST